MWGPISIGFVGFCGFGHLVGPDDFLLSGAATKHAHLFLNTSSCQKDRAKN